MATSLSTFRTAIGDRLKDDAAGQLQAAEKTAAVLAALGEYQQGRPREVAKLVTSTGAYDYAVSSNLPDFSDGFSLICSILYPWDGITVPYPMDDRYYSLGRLPTGAVLRFDPSFRPASGAQFMVNHTAQHNLTEAASTVWVGDEEALKDLCASHACEFLAGFYSQSTDASISADTVDHRSKGDMFRSQAKRWRDSYLMKLPKAKWQTQVPVVRA